MRRENVSEETSFVRKCVVVLCWVSVCSYLLFDKEKIQFEDVGDFIKEHVQCIVAWTWYASMATASCTLCVIGRLILGTYTWELAEPILATAFHIGLATMIPLSEPKFDMSATNTPFEEVLLSVTAGYCFYETLFFRFKMEDGWRLWLVGSTVSFIITFLGLSHGANVFLTIAFLFSSSVPVMKLPSFGSSTYVDTVAYRASVWAASIFMIHQRLLVALPIFISLLKSPETNWRQFEFPIYLSAYSLVASLVQYLVTALVGQRPTDEESRTNRDLEESELFSEAIQTHKRKLNEPIS